MPLGCSAFFPKVHCGCAFFGCGLKIYNHFQCFPRKSRRKTKMQVKTNVGRTAMKTHKLIGMCRMVGKRRYSWTFGKYIIRARFLRARTLRIKLTQLMRKKSRLDQSSPTTDRTTERVSWRGQTGPVQDSADKDNKRQDQRRLVQHKPITKVCEALLGRNLARFVIHWWMGNRFASLLTLGLRFLRYLKGFNPWTGTRVGEAKNPGPGGSAATWRKRMQKQRRNQQDSQLAAQLLSVLETFQTGHKNKRVKTTHQTGSQPGGLAGSLMETLKQAMSEQWTDSDAAKRMMDSLTICSTRAGVVWKRCC